MGLDSLKNGNVPSIRNLITGNKITLEKILDNVHPNKLFPSNYVKQIEIDMKYDVYIKRQLNDIKQLEVEQKTLIPEGINFREIKGLSNESIDILTQYKPSTIRQASLIPGFTSSALFLLLHYLKNNRIKSA